MIFMETIFLSRGENDIGIKWIQQKKIERVSFTVYSGLKFAFIHIILVLLLVQIALELKIAFSPSFNSI